MYERKILLIREYDNTYTLMGKTLGGVVKLLFDGKNVKMSLSITNADMSRMGLWKVYIYADGKFYEFERQPQTIFAAPGIDKVSIIITAERLNKHIVGYANTHMAGLNKELAQHFSLIETKQPPKQALPEATQNNNVFIGANAEEITEYEKFLEKTNNYYLAGKEEIERSEALHKYANAIRAYNGKMNYYSLVKDSIAEIFEKYPIYDSLTNAVKDSAWVKITREKGRYFAFGIVTENSEPKYICYALPSKTAMRPAVAQYLNAGNGYWVIIQDASSGGRAEGKLIV